MVKPPPLQPLSLQNSEYTHQLLVGALSDKDPFALPYMEEDRWLIRQHLLALSDAYPSLQLRTATFTHNNGHSVNLLQAGGTIPTVYHHDIPIVIWLMECYPQFPPLVFVESKSDMIINRQNRFHPVFEKLGF